MIMGIFFLKPKGTVSTRFQRKGTFRPREFLADSEKFLSRVYT